MASDSSSSTWPPAREELKADSTAYARDSIIPRPSFRRLMVREMVGSRTSPTYLGAVRSAQRPSPVRKTYGSRSDLVHDSNLEP